VGIALAVAACAASHDPDAGDDADSGGDVGDATGPFDASGLVDGSRDAGCSPPRRLCSGACTDVSASLEHCGACDARCEIPAAVAACTDGRCALTECLEGRGNCDGSDDNGCETDLTSDWYNCGRCGIRCGLRRDDGSFCVDGICVICECGRGYANCDGDCRNGCETWYNPESFCRPCRPCELPNAVADCDSDGACVIIVACETGFADCNAVTSDGCEVDTRSAVDHCGSCFTPCAPGSMCVEGSCLP
jgi:hypothetical protein